MVSIVSVIFFIVVTVVVIKQVKFYRVLAYLKTHYNTDSKAENPLEANAQQSSGRINDTLECCLPQTSNTVNECENETLPQSHLKESPSLPTSTKVDSRTFALIYTAVSDMQQKPNLYPNLSLK